MSVSKQGRNRGSLNGYQRVEEPIFTEHDSIRRQFPGTRDKIFLDAACMSLCPEVSARAVERLTRDTMTCPQPSASAQHITLDTVREATRKEVARLVGASDDEIAVVESTTVGLNQAAAAIPFEDGDNVVFCDLEYLQVAIPFYNVQRHRDIELRPVRHRDGLVTVDDFAGVCDARTRAIVVSSVQWTNGLKLDLSALSELAERHDAWLVVDAIQHLGAARLDLAALRVDFLACGGHKWLNAPFGCGFLYLRRERFDQVEPPARGYLTLEEPEGGWATYFATPSITPFRDYRYTRNAKKFEAGGTANYPGAVALTASLRLINELGVDGIEHYIRDLSRELLEGLYRRGVRVITPDEDRLRAGIVTFRLFANPARDAAFCNYLAEQKIYVSTRYTSNVGGTRVSVHFFNNRADIERLLEAVDAYPERLSNGG